MYKVAGIADIAKRLLGKLKPKPLPTKAEALNANAYEALLAKFKKKYPEGIVGGGSGATSAAAESNAMTDLAIKKQEQLLAKLRKMVIPDDEQVYSTKALPRLRDPGRFKTNKF